MTKNPLWNFEVLIFSLDLKLMESYQSLFHQINMHALKIVMWILAGGLGGAGEEARQDGVPV